MKCVAAFVTVVAAGGVLAGCSPRVDEIVTLRPDDPDLEPLAWLAGDWVALVEGARVEEHWTQPAGKTMLGMNRTVAGARTVFFEYLRIEQTEDGIVYLASPLGRQPPTRFRLVQAAKNQVVFENPEHDFPQRIIYRREGNLLHASIEGTENGQPKATAWTFVRAQYP